ncbi:hypothetical protein THII_1023 [Thioploca ingrica]|uniref:Secreted protein n=1 Tax=Thioploca ingrica TaxID=40754 RepID=A0A090AK23_9GAMM|nr:hypothetical protein THII_1023 [Thioploca ingrica]
MKKTSLVLAISALLFGTSSSYVLADMSSDEIQQYLNSTPENAPAPEGDGTLGFDPPQALPKNVAVAGSDQPIYWKGLKMCNPSFAVNGPAMAEFPVTVNGSVGTWSADKKTVTGPGWTLKPPVGDSWSSQWKLTVESGTVITSILLEPFKRKDPDQMRYAFDIGGKLPRYPAPRTEYEHTPDAARGQFIVQMTPGTPSPIFTATYSGPIYTGSMMEGRISTLPDYPDFHGPIGDSTDIPLASPYGTGDPKADRKPTHDLYSTLEIKFDSKVTGDLLIDPGFSFVADTDCLPVSEVKIISYENGILKFIVVGEGAVAIMDNAQKLVQGPFMVDRGQGQATFTTQFVPTAGSCYSMMDVDTLKVMTQNYCF